jgi:indole-3-glycerol phosphate synthase
MPSIERLRQELEALKPLEKVVEQIEESLAERNRLIVALTRQHVRTALIAEAARVSPSRIYQVVNSAPAGNEADLTAQRSEIDRHRQLVEHLRR